MAGFDCFIAFTGAFLAAGIVLAIGIVAYVFILGPARADRRSAGQRDVSRP
jgi:hypothetical protein